MVPKIAAPFGPAGCIELISTNVQGRTFLFFGYAND